MVCFPVINSLQVDDYGLFPGPEPERDGLRAAFHPGLTLVLGANGLGKTTLVWLLYRMLSGPYDIPGLTAGGDLGSRRLEPRPLRGGSRRLFANRVVDGASTAVARLSFDLGEHSINITRQLNDLTLSSYSVDNEERSTNERQSYQAGIANMAGVWSFGDWILLLRYLTFYFEDRRELVWDTSAQRQILRLLFLPANIAKEWTEAERRVLKLDSRVRNLSAALTREERDLEGHEKLEESAPDIREALKSLIELQEADELRREELDEMVFDLDGRRRTSRLAYLRAQHDRESTFRALEHAKLLALQERFPSASDTARYILAQLFVDSECLVCGTRVPDVAHAFETRLLDSQCVVCASSLPPVPPEETGPTVLSDERVTRTAHSLAQADATVATAQLDLDRYDSQYQEARGELELLDVTMAQRRQQIEALIRRLPPEEAALHEQREELARLRTRVESLKEKLTTERDTFGAFITTVKRSLLESAPKVKEIFENYAREFLIENCSLVWSLRKERVGQTGTPIEFPAFELDLASASFRSPVRRHGPEEVSESQREFIDLSFRMALMATAQPDSGGTLVIDAPESSLDAVFVNRAAQVLSRFASFEQGNRLLITSNLTDGKLIPQLLDQVDSENWQERVIDLFNIAEPTAAVRQYTKEYAAVMHSILSTRERKDDSG